MMKKNGFTLAEVLITLAIIGVVATMTLPALMTNTGEQQAKSALKKAINTLTEAGQMNQALNGINYDTMTATSTKINSNADDEAGVSFIALLRARTAIDFTQTVDGSKLPTVGTGITGHGTTAPDTAVYFRDGSCLLFSSSTAPDGTIEADNMTKGMVVVIDTNGKKGPNALSNCSGNKKGYSEQKESGVIDLSTSITNCNDKTKRVINDRFLLRLRGSVAQPEGEAATWAVQN